MSAERRRLRVTIVAGARPNFIKIAPLFHALRSRPHSRLKFRLVHTGQHYSRDMSGAFFSELGIPDPDTNLNVGSGTQAEQTARIMTAFEQELSGHPADVVAVVGDVNSTLACSIVAKKAGVRLVHIEAGIRSFDLDMPEEINRMVTDALADHFFTTSEYANRNLRAQGVAASRISFVGNIMIDSLRRFEPSFVRPEWLPESTVRSGYWVLTLHRPSNVDDAATLRSALSRIDRNAGGRPVFFPVHPRTMRTLETLQAEHRSIVPVGPQGYLSFLYLVKHALGVITDSGGIQEETTVMKVPCLTLRRNTERPETVSLGTNVLVPRPAALPSLMRKVLDGRWKSGKIPPKWDGKTAERIITILERWAGGER